MSGFSDYLENQLFTATLRGGNYNGGAVYAALFTSNPGDSGTGVELADSSYVRQRCHNSVVSDGFTAPVNGSGSNTRLIVFPAIFGPRRTVTHWGLFDAATGGNLLYHAPLTNPKTLDPSDVLSFPVGSLVVTLD